MAAENSIEQLKNLVFAAKSRESRLQPDPYDLLLRRRRRRTLEKFMQSLSGLDASKFSNVLEEDREEIRGIFQKQVTEAAKHLRAAEVDFHLGIEAHRKALTILRNPFNTSFGQASCDLAVPAPPFW
jgi:hypothetical protein